jgi:hypothetical protein
MAVNIVILHKDASRILDIVKELKGQGLVQGVDFDFAFHQSRWDEMIGEVPKETVFTFYSEKYATLFALKHT